MSVLITAGLTLESQRLAALFNSAEVMFGDQLAVPSFFRGRFLQLPQEGDNGFAHKVLNLCLDHNITLLLPLKPNEIAELATSQELFSEFGIRIVLPSDKVTLPATAENAQNERSLCLILDGRIHAGTLRGIPELPESVSGAFTVNYLPGAVELDPLIVENA